jgi:hypothetical protein
MKVDDIRVFLPCENYDVSQSFYQKIGFTLTFITDDLSLLENGECSFFLQRFYNAELVNNLMLQLIVLDINDVFNQISNIKGFDIKYEPIKSEPWGKVIYLWGPSGELWHITKLND